MSVPNQPQINVPSMDYSAAFAPNPWANISGLINQTLTDRKQNLQDQEDRQYLLQQRKAQQQQLDMQAAKSKLEMLKPILLGDPKKASDPQYIDIMRQIHKDLGVPLPLNDDGSLNLNEYKTPWSQVDDKMTQYILSVPQAQRKVILDRYSGVPQDAYTTDAAISAKDQAALQRALTSVKSEEDRTKIETERTKIAADRAQAYEAGNYARVNQIDANTNKIIADTARIAEQTREMPIKLAQAQQRLNDQLERTKLIGQRGAGGGFQATRLLNSEAVQAARLFTEADNSYKSLNLAYQNALSQNADPNDPSMVAIKAQLDEAEQRRNSLKTTYDNAQNFLSGEAAALATGGQLSTATGNPTTVVSTPSSSPQEGQRATSKSGKPIIFRNGQWQYE